MRVLHVGKFFPPAPGGMETYLRDLCLGLAGRGVENHVLCHRHAPEEPAQERPAPGVEVERVPVACSLCYSLLSPAFPLRLRRAVRRLRPDVLHVHLPNLSGFFALLPGMPPTVLHWHSDVTWPRDKRLARMLYGAYAPLESLLLSRAALVVATSQPYLEASPVLSRVRDKCRVVPLGARRERLPVPSAEACRAARGRWAPDLPDEACLIVSAGRFAHYKGYEVLVEAMRHVPDATLVMVGEGETHRAVARRVRELGLGGRVRLTGWLPDEELRTLVAAADVFCLPSVERSEAFGVVLVEAMALGTCCVCTDVPGAGPSWVNAHGETGLVVPVRDARALGRALAEMAGDEKRREAMGRAAAARFESHFRLEATLPAIEAVYAEAMGCGPA